LINDKILTDSYNIEDSAKVMKPGYYLRGEVFFTNELGELLFKKDNLILIGGKKFLLEKLFNITPNSNQQMTLNKLFDVNTNEPTLVGVGPRRESSVCLFGVGDGGSGMTFGDVYTPHGKEYNLYNMLPMRYVSKTSDLDSVDKFKYYMKVTNDTHYAYYLKRFETDPKLVLKVGQMDYVPSINDNNPISTVNEVLEREDVESYVELRLKISASDIREFFIENDNLDRARFNELALYTGYQPEHNSNIWTDYLNVQCFSKLTFNNDPLDSVEKEVNILYRIHI